MNRRLLGTYGTWCWAVERQGPAREDSVQGRSGQGSGGDGGRLRAGVAHRGTLTRRGQEGRAGPALQDLKAGSGCPWNCPWPAGGAPQTDILESSFSARSGGGGLGIRGPETHGGAGRGRGPGQEQWAQWAQRLPGVLLGAGMSLAGAERGEEQAGPGWDVGTLFEGSSRGSWARGFQLGRAGGCGGRGLVEGRAGSPSVRLLLGPRGWGRQGARPPPRQGALPGEGARPESSRTLSSPSRGGQEGTVSVRMHKAAEGRER
ncbi:hypothetical protein H1C71_012298 [Ictidomys tridecemlineatus]|nr:hypothetical protein H1C71_012298 [Ictidomys tridecemlineatus]